MRRGDTLFFPFRFRLRQVLLHPELGNAPDQVVGDRLVERELQRALACPVLRDLSDEMLDARRVGAPDGLPSGYLLPGSGPGFDQDGFFYGLIEKQP